MDWLTYKACKFNEATRLINEYSTPLVLTFLAVERLIVVVFPFRAKQLLNKWLNYFKTILFILFYHKLFRLSIIVFLAVVQQLLKNSDIGGKRILFWAYNSTEKLEKVL